MQGTACAMSCWSPGRPRRCLGSQAGMESLAQTEADMRSAVFCVCPPGAQQCLAIQSVGGYRGWARPLRDAAAFCACPLGSLLLWDVGDTEGVHGGPSAHAVMQQC